MYKKQASTITGGLSQPGKMPEGSYNLPAAACQTGQILAKVEGTPCSGCYALKGRYRFPNVKDALARRLDSLKHPDWVRAMTVLITGIKHFRWHDSGDIQSSWHLQQIFKVCEATPDTMHWLPTQEISRAPGTCNRSSKYVKQHQRPVTGCQHRSANTCRWRAPQFRPI